MPDSTSRRVSWLIRVVLALLWGANAAVAVYAYGQWIVRAVNHRGAPPASAGYSPVTHHHKETR
jgi:hypothetical protein